MLTDATLAKLNSILGDRMGRLTDGTPSFRFMRTKDLQFPVRTGSRTVKMPSGLFLEEPIYEMAPQAPELEDTWCIAKWMPPPSREEWDEKYGKLLEYPQNGFWFMFTPLRPGADPDEDWAYFVSDHVNWQRSLSYQQCFDLIMNARKRKDEAHRQEVVALARDNFVNHVPGARGGDYSVPTTRFDR